VFLSDINTSFALKETGTSNYNTFGSFVVEGGFASNAFNLVGSASAVRPGGTDVTFNGGPLAITAGATIYLTSGSSADSISGAPVVYEGYATQLIVECSTAPGVGQTFVATFLINGVASALTTTISGTNFFNSATTVVYVGPGVSVVLQVVASAGAAASNIRACFVINS
jgi:hypothetical protein